MIAKSVISFLNSLCFHISFIIIIIIISNGNWTEWSTIQGVIFDITSTIIPELYDTNSNYQLIVSITKCKNVHYM